MLPIMYVYSRVKLFWDFSRVSFQLGKTEGLLTIVRGVPHNVSRLKKVYLPTSLLAESGISTESLVRHNFDQDKLKKLVETIASVSDEHLNNSKFRSKFLSKDEKKVMLPAVAANRFMTRLSRAECDVYNTQLQARDSILPAVLYWNYIRGSYWNTFSIHYTYDLVQVGQWQH